MDGYVACTPGFDTLPAVLDAASETFVEVLGKASSTEVVQRTRSPCNG